MRLKPLLLTLGVWGLVAVWVTALLLTEGSEAQRWVGIIPLVLIGGFAVGLLIALTYQMFAGDA